VNNELVEKWKPLISNTYCGDKLALASIYDRQLQYVKDIADEGVKQFRDQVRRFVRLLFMAIQRTASNLTDAGITIIYYPFDDIVTAYDDATVNALNACLFYYKDEPGIPYHMDDEEYLLNRLAVAASKSLIAQAVDGKIFIDVMFRIERLKTNEGE